MFSDQNVSNVRPFYMKKESIDNKMSNLGKEIVLAINRENKSCCHFFLATHNLWFETRAQFKDDLFLKTRLSEI